MPHAKPIFVTLGFIAFMALQGCCSQCVKTATDSYEAGLRLQAAGQTDQAVAKLKRAMTEFDTAIEKCQSAPVDERKVQLATAYARQMNTAFQLLAMSKQDPPRQLWIDKLNAIAKAVAEGESSQAFKLRPRDKATLEVQKALIETYVAELALSQTMPPSRDHITQATKLFTSGICLTNPTIDQAMAPTSGPVNQELVDKLCEWKLSALLRWKKRFQTLGLADAQWRPLRKAIIGEFGFTYKKLNLAEREGPNAMAIQDKFNQLRIAIGYSSSSPIARLQCH